MYKRNFWFSVALAIAALVLVPAIASQTSSTPTATDRSKQMSSANERVVTYIAAWNERDEKRRRELVAKTWADDGTYVDAHRSGSGHEAIDVMIAQAQRQFPGYTLRLISGIEAHNGNVRFSWAAGGSEQAPLYLGGTDFATMSSDGRFHRVVGFVDAAPAR